MSAVLAVCFTVAGMWQLDQRTLLRDRADVTGTRRLLITGICWVFTIGLIT